MITFLWPGDGQDDPPIRFHHNGDFSGDVIAVLPVGSIEPVDVDAGRAWVRIPFDALKELVAEYVRSERIQFYEGASSDEVLRVR